MTLPHALSLPGRPPAVALLTLALACGARAEIPALRLDGVPTAASVVTQRPTAMEPTTLPAVRRPASPREEISSLLNLGTRLTERGNPDYAAAEIAFWQVLNASDTQPAEIRQALLGLAHMHRKQGDLTKAVAIFERFLADFPGDDHIPDALLELGRTLRDLGAYKLAIARFYSVIHSTLKVDGGDFERYQVLAKTAQFEIAETHLAAGEFEEANKYYTKFRLLDIAPADRARAHFKAADALRRAGKLDDAVTALRAFVEQWPDDENNPEARYLLAVTLRDLKRPQEALGVALELLRIEKSRVASAPKRWLHWQLATGNQIANELFESGDTANAQTIYAALLELAADPGWKIPLTYQLGLCNERLGMTERARGFYQTVADAVGARPGAQAAELGRMAAWRLEHLDWRDATSHQVSAFFESGATAPLAALPATSNP